MDNVIFLYKMYTFCFLYTLFTFLFLLKFYGPSVPWMHVLLLLVSIIKDKNVLAAFAKEFAGDGLSLVRSVQDYPLPDITTTNFTLSLIMYYIPFLIISSAVIFFCDIIGNVYKAHRDLRDWERACDRLNQVLYEKDYPLTAMQKFVKTFTFIAKVIGVSIIRVIMFVVIVYLGFFSEILTFPDYLEGAFKFAAYFCTAFVFGPDMMTLYGCIISLRGIDFNAHSADEFESEEQRLIKAVARRPE